MKDGLLSVDIEREVPKQLKPRKIEIGATVAKGIHKTIDASRRRELSAPQVLKWEQACPPGAPASVSLGVLDASSSGS